MTEKYFLNIKKKVKILFLLGTKYVNIQYVNMNLIYIML